jgi:hypothetical protein
MRTYLGRSIPSLNQNKLRGVLAEIAFRDHLATLGFADRVSAGGWLARSTGQGQFANHTVVAFPEIIMPNTEYPPARVFDAPPNGLHSVCAVFQQIGVAGYFCQPVVGNLGDPLSVTWHALRLGVPERQVHQPLTTALSTLTARLRAYNFLRCSTDTSALPETAISEEFSKEHLRVSIQTPFLVECSDVDGVLWGQQFTYPIEIKEKTVAKDNRVGQYFGIDTGPFVKLAYYAARRGNLRSLFVVREIDQPTTRNLVGWWYITFEALAQVASWVPQAGGTNMGGGGSTVVKIPKAAFAPLDANALRQL